MVVPNINFTPDDFKRSESLQLQELIDPLTSENMFRSIVYVALSPRERYSTQMKMYDRLIGAGLDNSQSIVKRSEEEIAYYVRGLKKAGYIKKLADWWPNSGIDELIFKDIEGGRTKEFDIREKIVKEGYGKGISYKCASLFMNGCGYREVVAVDSWVLMLEVALGYPVRSYKYEPKDGRKYKHTYLGNGVYKDGGITSRKEYLLYEKNFIEIARNNGYHQFDFKMMYWAKNSSWNARLENDILQLKLELSHDKNNTVMRPLILDHAAFGASRDTSEYIIHNHRKRNSRNKKSGKNLDSKNHYDIGF